MRVKVELYMRVDILDEQAVPTGKTASLAEANTQGLWRAGVHVGLYTADRRVLVQQRSKSLDLFPGMWELGVGGSVLAGESIYEAVLRVVDDELGVLAKNLQPVTRWKYNHQPPNSMLHPKVFLYAFVAQIDPAQLRLHQSQVHQVRLLPPREAHQTVFQPKGVPHVHLEPYQPYYRQILTAIEACF